MTAPAATLGASPGDVPSLPGCAGPDDLRLWSQAALPGERVAYHQGWLAVDRDRRIDMTDDELAAATRVRDLGAMAALLERQGTLRLSQRRLGEGRWLYIAEKRA